ncbi:MAG: GHKL domain-containing protein [Clostridia bacterium]|nr:GHKL domain-containing protein [Clostridia bacterium]
MAWYGVEYLVNLLEIFLYTEFIAKNRELNVVPIKKVVTTLVAALLLLVVNIVGERYVLIAQYAFLFGAVIYFCMHWLLKREGIKTMLICIVQFFLIVLLSDILTILIMKLFSGVGVEGILEQSSDRLIAMVLSKTITLYLIKLFNGFKSQEVNQSKTYILAVYTALFLLNTLLSMTLLYLFSWTENVAYSDFYVLLGSSSIIGINMFIIFLTNYLISANKKEQDSIRWEQQNRYYEKYIGDIEESREAVHKLHHNYKHDMQCIKGLLQQSAWDDLKQYMQSIDYKLAESEVINFSCPVPLNALLNAKRDHALKSGINLELEVFMPLETAIDPYDLCNVVGNIFDNGIEACERLSEEEKKLRLEIYIQKKMLFINGVNAMPESLIYDDDKIVTTKTDKEFHGYGLSIINEIASKYGGYSTINTNAQEFNILVGIPFI